MKNVETTTSAGKWIRNVSRILLPIAYVLLLGWIFFNSLQTGQESSAQSSTVMEVVQTIAEFVAPDSYIATATGEDYDFIHSIIRTLAHFSEFALLGAMTGWCYCAYTFKKRYLYLPIGWLWLVPILDEYLQTFTPGRGAEVADMLTDTAGAMVGLLIALFSVWIGVLIYKKIKNASLKKAPVKKENDESNCTFVK